MKSDFGLIGRKLSHSFSKKFFDEKFQKLDLRDYAYHLYELESVDEVGGLLKKYSSLKGLNVTIPFKKDVFQILDDIEEKAARIGSVNVIKIQENGKLKGYNTDYYGFYKSLISWLDPKEMAQLSALVLGSGGASGAVCCVLEDLNIPYNIVSRKVSSNGLTYLELDKKISYLTDNKLIINTTPVGMFPKVNFSPAINYELISSNHYVYDLIYNPEETLLLKKSAEKGAKIKNGMEMLHLQAEKSWDIWSE